MKKQITLCPFCNKELIKAATHLYSCEMNTTITSKREIRFLYLQYNFPYLCVKDNLYNEYVIKQKSIPDFINEFGSRFDLLFMLDYFDIPKRSISESAKNISTKKYKQTCLNKYGVENISQLETIKEKKRQTFIKHYGVDNIRKSKEYMDALSDLMLIKYGKKRITGKHNLDYKSIATKISQTKSNFSQKKREEIAEKAKKTIKENYNKLSEKEKIELHNKRSARAKQVASCPNVKLKQSIAQKRRWENAPDEIKNQWIATILDSLKYTSKLESKLEEILLFNNIPYKRNCFIKGKQFDFCLKQFKVLIEVNGDYWHANPNIYNEDDLIKYPNNNIQKAKDVWNKDQQKKELAKNFNYDVVCIWEQEINSKNDEQVLQLLIERIKNASTTN